MSMNRATYQVLVLSMAMAPVVAFAQTTHNVELIVTDFVPKDITVQLGDTVHWVWVTPFHSHNVESGIVVNGAGVPNGIFRSGNPTSDIGTTWDLTIDQGFLDANPVVNNRYDYYCIVHTFFDMVGTVTVDVGGCTSDEDCDDGDACNGAETCVANACVDGTPMDCNDNDVCTQDSCADGACGHSAIAECCNSAGDCEDNDECTADACNANNCTNTTIDACCTTDADCGDGDACNGVERCQGTACADGTPMDCNDSDVCTQDSCTAGACGHSTIDGCCTSDSDCDDSNACTDDGCGGGTCSNVANTADCDDGDACTKNDVCSQGACSGVTIDDCDTCDTDSECDDSDECTTDSCANGACSFSAIVGCPASGAPLPVDSDTDGVEDDDDLCDETVAGASVDPDGCSCDQLDDDDDGTDNCNDRCPDTPDSQAADDDGCSALQLDGDGDGVSDALDDCPDTAQGQTVGDDGCVADSADDAATAPTPDDEDGAGQSVDLGSDDAGPPVRLCGLFGMIPWLMTLTGLHVLRHRRALGNPTTRGRSAARGDWRKKRP